MSDWLIKAENVSLRYRSGVLLAGATREVLRDVSLELNKGQTLGVFGANGCGKTSLLRVLAGILTPTEGTVRLRPGAKVSLLSLGVGFRRDLSGRDNALLSLMLQGATKRDARSKLEEIKEFSELGEYFDQALRIYSAGMQSRLAFATAVSVGATDVLLIDETLSVGDMRFREKATEKLEEIRTRVATVFVSHSAQQVENVCERAFWLEQGVVRMSGASAEVGAEYRKFMQRAS